MEQYTREELQEALQIISSLIQRCEKMQPKFAEGTSQHTLLKNRIKALVISKAYIANDASKGTYTKEELVDAQRPIASIISKCSKAQQKFAEGTPQYNRFQHMIHAMNISTAFLLQEIG